jgi:hypothetical protein
MCVKGNHPLVWNTCVNWASLCGRGGIAMAKGLGIIWKLHTTYCTQSSEKVEYMNRTLKLQLGKLCQESHLQWNQLLPMHYWGLGVAPWNGVLYGCPSSLIKGIWGDHKEIGDFTLRQQMKALGWLSHRSLSRSGRDFLSA